MGNKTRKSLDSKPDWEREAFDISTKNAKSPSLRRLNYVENKHLKEAALTRSEQQGLIPYGYEQALMQQKPRSDLFTKLGVSPQDKMAFFLLKWVWNSVAEDGTVTKKSLVHQLQSNKELLAALSKQSAQLKSELGSFRSAQSDLLDWTEFMDFFFY